MTRAARRLPGSFEDRCLAEPGKQEVEARALPPGPKRDEMLRRARPKQIALHLDEWLSSPGLQPPT